jgi:hypothetical protein
MSSSLLVCLAAISFIPCSTAQCHVAMSKKTQANHCKQSTPAAPNSASIFIENSPAEQDGIANIIMERNVERCSLPRAKSNLGLTRSIRGCAHEGQTATSSHHPHLRHRHAEEPEPEPQLELEAICLPCSWNQPKNVLLA